MPNSRSLFVKRLSSYVHQMLMAPKRRVLSWTAVAGMFVFGLWGISVAASSSPMSVTDYAVTPEVVGVGGVSSLKATLRSSKNVAPAYALLTVPPHFSLDAGKLPAECKAGTYASLAADSSRQLPPESDMTGPGKIPAAEFAQTTMVYCEKSKLDEGASWGIEFPVQGTKVGYQRSFAFTASGAPIEGGWASEMTQSELTVVQAVDLGVTKTASPSPVDAGEMVTYTMVVTNSSPDAAAPSVTLTDKLPAATDLEIEDLPAGCSRNGNVLTCALGALPANGSKTIVLKGRVLQSRGTQTNDVEVKLSEGVTSVKEVNFDKTSPTSRNEHSVTVDVKPVVKLKATKKMTGAGGGNIVAGQMVHMTLGAKNTGVVTANNVVVTDRVPKEFTEVASSDPRCTVGPWSSTGTPVTCTVGTLVKDQDMSGIFTLTMKAPATTTALTGKNTADVAATKPADATLETIGETVNYEILPSRPEFSISKGKKAWVGTGWRNDVPAVWGNKLQSTIVVKNDAVKATAVMSMLDDNGKPRVITVKEKLEEHEKFTGYSGDGWTCDGKPGTSGPQTMTCTYTLTKDLAIGEALPALLIESVAEGTVAADITNTASVAQVVPGLPDASTSATLPGVPATAKLGLEKKGTLNKPDPSDPTKDTIDYFLTIKNEGPDVATNVKVVDTLPMWFKPTTGAATKVTVDFSQAPTGTSCPKTAQSNAVVECVLGALDKDKTATIKITVGRPFNVNNLANQFSISSVDTQIPNQNDPPAKGGGDLSATALADVTISQVQPPATPMQVGVSSTFRTDFANLGANAAEGVVIRQSVNLELMDVKNFTLSKSDAGTCKIEKGTPLSKSFVVCTMTRPLEPNESLQLSMEQTPIFGGAYDNLALDVPCSPAGRMARTALVRNQCAPYDVEASISTGSEQSNKNNDTGSGKAMVQKESVDLAIKIEDNYDGLVQDPSPLNGEVKYLVAISNNGPSVATKVSFYLKAIPPNETGFSMESVSFPPELSCVKVSNDWQWKCDLANGGVMEANTTQKFYLPFKVAADNTVVESLSGFKTYALSGKVFSSETSVGEAEGGIGSDTKQSNNETRQTTVVVPRAVLTVTKTANPKPVAVHQPFTYEITVTNTGPSAAANVLVKDTLADQLELQPGKSAGSTFNGVDCKMSGQVLTCTVKKVLKDQSVTVSIPVRVKLGTTATSLPNKAQAAPPWIRMAFPAFSPKSPWNRPR